ncbi:MAG TPA: hypothetical protein PLL36_12725, partial [Candidatus Hydrogenedentes bacterium]|nr:hypothetical protein [Candidatus Hydrogenedentota bacterium]
MEPIGARPTLVFRPCLQRGSEVVLSLRVIAAIEIRTTAFIIIPPATAENAFGNAIGHPVFFV